MPKQSKKTKSSASRPRSRPLSDIVPSGTLPVAVGYTSTKCDPIFTNTDKSVRVRNSEFVTSVSLNGAGPVPFANALISLPINPGIPSVFPWLSQIANQYEMYRFHRLTFKYVPKQATSFPGCVSMVMDYDALDPAPEDRATLLSYSGCVTTVVWQALTYNVPANKLGLFAQQRYTRLGNFPDLDLKTYDLGKLLVCPDDQSPHTSTANIGDLFVEYEVELFTPQLRIPVAAGYVSGTKPVLDTTPFPPVFEARGGSIPCSFNNNSNGETELKFDRPWEGLLTIAQRVSSGTWPGMTSNFTTPSNGKITTLDIANNDSQGRTIWDCAIKAYTGDILVLKMSQAAAFLTALARFTSGPYKGLGGV